MKLLFSVATSIATTLLLSMVVLAQASSQTPTQTQPATPTTAQQDQPVTVIGCVQREADYRKAQGAGGAGVAGTGVGAGNEFVLVNASMAPAPGTPGATAGTPTGTAGTTSTAYELTGQNESQVGQHVGRRVEISGKLKPAEVGAAGPTGGATAAAPPRGVDVTSQDLKLRELEVTTVRTATGTCPAQ